MVPNVIYYYKPLGVLDARSYVIKVDGTGEELTVYIKGLVVPLRDGYFPCEKDAWKKGVEYLVERFRKAGKVEVEHVQRDGQKLLADVFVDGNNLADELVKAGVAAKDVSFDWCSAIFAR